MSKYTPVPVTNIGGNPTSAGNTINDNFDTISDVLDTLVSRDGVAPNQMTADLDMNHNDLLSAGAISADSIESVTLLVNGSDLTVTLNAALAAAETINDNADAAASSAAQASSASASASASASSAAASAATAVANHITWRGAWVTSTAYALHDAVQNGGSSYIVTAAHTSSAGNQPGVGGSWTLFWNLLAQSGSTGATGPTGSTGAQGPAATITVGTVTTGAPASSVIVTNSGTTGAAILNFTIPKGDTGASGAGTGDMVAANNLSELTNKPQARTNLGSTTIGDALFISASAAAARTTIGAGTGSGTVTSAAMTVPTGLAVSGTPITTTGTFAVTWSGIIPVAQGSTGLASYAIGDTLYADSTSSLARLAKGTSTQVHIGGNTPSWGAVDLTTMITGILPLANGGTGSTAYATTAQYRSATTGKFLTADVWSAAATVALTSGTSIALDLSTGINFTLTLGANGTLSNPSNVKVGQTGFIMITQDATGSRTLAYGTNYKWAGGSVGVLSTTPAAIDVLYYQVLSSTQILLSLVKGIA